MQHVTVVTYHATRRSGMNAQETTEIRELSVEEMESATGGLLLAVWRTQLIHMDYHNLNNFNDPTAVRYA
jgi:hypothetical protein